jgi:CelD/BcsL family acetyltransferase involved in cellulose biosynthesis
MERPRNGGFSTDNEPTCRNWSTVMTRSSLTPPGHVLALEVINTEKRFEGIRGEWTELLTHSSANCIFLTWEWLHTWWKHLAGGSKLHILAIRSGADLIAIAPLASSSTKLVRLTHIRALEFLGTGSVGSDYLDIIARREKEDEALEVLADYLLREKFVLDLKQLVKHGSLALQLAARLQEQRWNRSEICTNICPFIDLAGHTWESFQAALGPKHRYNFHRRLKNLHREFDARFECIVSEDQRSAALGALVALHNKRMQGRGGSDGLHTSQLVGFHEELTRLALSRGWLRLFVLTLNGESAAALYGFIYGKKFYFYQSGFDPRYSPYSVGLVTMGLAIEAAIEDGAEEFDLLHGDEKYKSLWAKTQRDLVRLELSPPTPRAWMYRKSMGLNRLARRAVRMSLTRLQSPLWSEAK